MAKSARTPQFGPGTGSGRRPIPDDLYLVQWAHVVELLKAGHTTAQIKEKHGTCAETVRRICRLMVENGWTPPKRVPAKIVRPVRVLTPRLRMTVEERLQKHSGVVARLRVGETMAQAAKLEGVSMNTVQVLRRALAALGKESNGDNPPMDLG